LRAKTVAISRTVRPALVVLDDPQTDESARSLSQCANRESVLAGAVLGLAGPGKKISGIMPCTVRVQAEAGGPRRSQLADPQRAWLKRLNRRNRRIAEELAAGNRPMDVARRFKISPARISQIRTECRRSWAAMHGDASEPELAVA